MANKQMKTLTLGTTTYEIVDEAARTDIENLNLETLGITVSNIDLTAGTSPLATGTHYCVYE